MIQDTVHEVTFLIHTLLPENMLLRSLSYYSVKGNKSLITEKRDMKIKWTLVAQAAKAFFHQVYHL